VQSLHQPRAQMYVCDTMGEWPERCVEALLESGRLTFATLAARLAGKHTTPLEEATAHAAQSVAALMREGYLEQVKGWV